MSEQERVATLIKDSLPDSVYAANPWCDRIYINPRHFNKSWRGDKNNRVFVDDRGVVIFDKGNGKISPGCKEDLNAIHDFVQSTGLRFETRS